MKIAIIGGGPGGYVAAIRAAQLGVEVILIEAKHLGGTCLNEGCIPTKVLLNTSEHLEKAKCDYKNMGIDITGIQVNWKQLQKRKKIIVRKLVAGVKGLLKKNNVIHIIGEGTFISRNQIEVKNDDSKTVVDFDYAVIATGSEPALVPISGIDREGVITSNEALSLEEVPKSLAIIGGGVIGSEFAEVFNPLGCKITVIEMLSHIVANMDCDISESLKDKFIKNGIDIYTDTKVTSITENSDGLCVNTQSASGENSVTVEKVLLSVGRKPVTENLNLDGLGIMTEKGAIVVDENMKTNIDNIYAIGDCIGGIMLAHVASAQGITAVESIMNKKSDIDFRTIPYCVYTRPELAGVGLTEEQAEEKGYDFKVGVFPMPVNGKAMIEGETEGMVKYIADSNTGKILGLHIAGPRATDLIVEGALAIRVGATVDELISTVHAHPTVGEALQEAAHEVFGKAVHL